MRWPPIHYKRDTANTLKLTGNDIGGASDSTGVVYEMEVCTTVS